MDPKSFVQVTWQEGTIPESGVNGCQPEDVLRVALDRLRELNAQFPCRENALAITKLEEAIMWLEKRTENRRAQGVEGRHEAHQS